MRWAQNAFTDDFACAGCPNLQSVQITAQRLNTLLVHSNPKLASLQLNTPALCTLDAHACHQAGGVLEEFELSLRCGIVSRAEQPLCTCCCPAALSVQPTVVCTHMCSCLASPLSWLACPCTSLQLCWAQVRGAQQPEPERLPCPVRCRYAALLPICCAHMRL